jgi:hypothetical protein
MKRTVLRLSWLAILGLSSVSAEISLARTQGPKPSEVLKSRGLMRIKGSSANWALEDEAIVLRKFRTVKSLAAQFEAAQRAQSELAVGRQDPGELIGYCRTQINMLDQGISAIDQELANLGPPGGIQAAVHWHNMLVEKRNGMLVDYNRLGTLVRNLSADRGQIQRVKQQLAGELERVRRPYTESVGELRELVDTILKNYESVAKKEDVAQALMDLSKSLKTRQKFGPSRDLQAAIKWLERSEKSSSQRHRRPRSGPGRQ